MGFPLHRPYPYSLYRWGFLHFRHLKCLVIDGLCAIFKSPSYFLSSRACESCEGLATPYHPWDWYIHPYIGLILMVHIWHIYHTWIQWAILSGFSHHTCFWSRHLMSRCFAGESKNRPGTLASESYRVCRFDICICTLQGINISHLGKRKLIFKNALVGDMLIPRRVSQFSQLKLNHWKKNWHKKKTLLGCFLLPRFLPCFLRWTTKHPETELTFEVLKEEKENIKPNISKHIKHKLQTCQSYIIY